MSKPSFNQKLTALLKNNPDFLDDTDELIPVAVRDHAWRLDLDLIKLLLKNDKITQLVVLGLVKLVFTFV